MIITYDSTKAVTVTKKDDCEYLVKQYDLESYEMTFEERIGGQKNMYIKLKEVEQSPSGKKYAIVYNDDGKFYMRSFGKESRTEEQIRASLLDINKLLKINNYTMCHNSFPDPYTNCTFISETRLYISVFHNYDLVHYHFIYDLE